MSEQNNLKIAEEKLAAINARDIDGFVSYLDEPHDWDSDAFPGQYFEFTRRDMAESFKNRALTKGLMAPVRIATEIVA